ncbi:MAG TPA: low-specificity L-threonine aldolase [Nitrospirales bacterium]|nr:low-specificity L-threonine aldolase [Nitrospirales bacterium]
MIDLRSDTVTKPSPAMREAMATAEVGDDVFGEDPTINRLQEVAARLLGKEAALFVPSGTMANQLSVRLHTQPGDEIIVEAGAHVVRYESGAAAGLSGVQTCWLTGTRGILEPEQVEAAIRPPEYHNPPTTLICLENTHNRGGGTIYPLDKFAAIRKVAEAKRIAMHLDGARLFNAVVATGIPAAEYARHFETVSFCLSKGLGAPVGSLICADATRIVKLRRLRKMFGGGMRQAGILAAAGLYALDSNIARLAEDHAHAKRLAATLAGLPGLRINPAHVETNIVVFDISETGRTAEEVLALLKVEGLLLVPFSPTTLRAVTHLDVSSGQIDQACAILKKVFAA